MSSWPAEKNMKMRKSGFSYGPFIIAAVALVVLGGMLFFYFQLRSFDKRLSKVEPAAAENIQKTTAIVNFINASLQAQQAKK